MGPFRRKKPAKQPLPGSLQVAEFSTVEDLVHSIRAYVTPPEKVSAVTAQNAPSVLPGLVMVIAVLMGDRVNFLPYSTILELAGDPEPVWQFARLSVKNLDGIQIEHETVVAERDDTDIVSLVADDPFVASRVVVLDWLVEQLFGAFPEYGVLVSLPVRQRLLLHRISGAGVRSAMSVIRDAAHTYFTYADPVSQISPHVYLAVPGGRVERITRRQGEEGSAVGVPSLLDEVLFAPPPAGLGLDRESGQRSDQ